MSPRNMLVINCGSSSLKFAVIEPESGGVVKKGLVERLGGPDAVLRVDGLALQALPADAGPKEVLDAVFPLVRDAGVVGVGHRVVHGGEHFSESVLVDADVMRRIDQCSDLAPLHNPANLAGIVSARSRFPDVPHVAVFDTAFHQTLPPAAYHYAIPYEFYETYKIRRYGFHGSSHRFVAEQAAQRLGRPLSQLQLITAHLGNGCSTCAIKYGQSVDTSMGLTPLEGLVMGTRSGDIDPNLHQFIAHKSGLGLDAVTDLFNRKSGLLGLSRLSNDMRSLLEAAPEQPLARLAVDVFCYRLARSVLGLCAGLERLDALVFTGGIGEHAAAVRAQTLAQLAFLGAGVDEARNERPGSRADGRITRDDSRLVALVIPTNEELVIARETLRLV